MFNKSKYVIYFNSFAKYDPGTNLSSLFTLNRTSKNFTLQYRLQELINNAFEIVFDDSIKIDDYVISNLEYGLGNGKRDKVSLIPTISLITNAYHKKEINIVPNEPDVSTTLFNNFFIKYSEEFLNQYWDNYWSNYGYDYEIGDNYNDRAIPEIANEIFSKFISDKYKRFDTKTSKDVFNDASILALAAVKKQRKSQALLII